MNKTKFEVYNRFDMFLKECNTMDEALEYVDGYEPEEAYLMDIVEVNYTEDEVEKMPVK
jgi:hypothetical protein